jgi:metal-sulfur cluster biosynthetic enzyme
MTAMTEDEVRTALREVIDPEIGLNVVDLGLVYRIAIEEGHVRIEMTMTTPACPLGEVIADDAVAKVKAHSKEPVLVQVELVWEPPWNPSMISADARRALGHGDG